ncbi:MAG: hypothetical protein J3T61_09350 [Candidatus Brocadiales bacterium]|nr:hypothetical protein [Candidatus Bathyanammoxibius sp.]
MTETRSSCKIVHIFTYWIGGKVTSFPYKMHKEPTADTTHFKFIDVNHTTLPGNVDNDFLQTSQLGQWYLKNENEITSGSRTYNDYLKRLIYNPSSVPGSARLGLRLSESSYRERPYEAVSVRLFRSGVLSIMLRWQISCPSDSDTSQEQELDAVADLVKWPERTVQSIDRMELSKKAGKPSNKKERTAEPSGKETGGLNILAARCARHVAELFAEDVNALAESFGQPKMAWFAEDAIKAKDPTLAISNFFDDWRPGYTIPYVGFIMENLPIQVRELVRLKEAGGEGPEKDAATVFCSQLVTLSTTSPSSSRSGFVKPVEYVLENNIARGNAIVMVDRRCTVTAGLSVKEPGTTPLLATLGFALECTFAASEALKRFIAELDWKAPQKNYAFNAHLATTYVGSNIIVPIKKQAVLDLLGTTVEDLLKVLSAARALSPCDDKITQVETYVTSRTVITAITEMKKLQLNNLIELAHNKMDAFTHLFETDYNFVSAKNEDATTDRVAKLTLWLSALTVALTVLTVLVIGATLYYGERHKVNGELIHEVLKDIKILMSRSQPPSP